MGGVALAPMHQRGFKEQKKKERSLTFSQNFLWDVFVTQSWGVELTSLYINSWLEAETAVILRLNLNISCLWMNSLEIKSPYAEFLWRLQYFLLPAFN